MRLRGLIQACSLACTLMIVSPAHAADPLRLEDAVVRALERNPDLAVFAHELEAQQGRIQQAGSRSPLEVGLLVENAFGSGTRSDFESAETTLSLGFLLEHGAMERRREAAVAGAGVLDTELRIRRIDVAADAARRFIAVLENQQHVVELRWARELAEQTLQAVQQRVRAAKVPQAEEARAQAQLARARLDEEHAEHQLIASRRQLAALWAEGEPGFSEARGDLNTLPPLAPFEALRGSLEKNPDFERFVSEQRLRESEVRVAESRRRPPWQVTAGVRRFEQDDDHAFVFGLTVPVASRDYGRGAVVAAQADLAQVDAKRTALRVRLDSDLFALYQELNHAYKEVTTLRDDVLPKMEQAVEESRYAYERGRYSYVEWIAAQRELLEMRRALSSAYADLHRNRVEIERLTGASLASLLR
jgi:cobalt-zinc-cadmium efflux system outer membrane protein